MMNTKMEERAGTKLVVWFTAILRCNIETSGKVLRNILAFSLTE